MIRHPSICVLSSILFQSLSFFPSASYSQNDNKVDKIFVNGNFLPMDHESARAEAIALSADRIIAVGNNDEIRRLIHDQTTVIDLAGKTILPGFFAAHDHFPSIGRVALFDIDLNSPPIGAMQSIDDIVRTLKNRAAVVSKDEWIVGRGYDDTLLAEKRHPTRVDLDLASTEHPIWIIHTSGHLGVANSRALALAGVTRDTTQPDGGVIRKDATSGEPTGIFEEKLTLINKHTPSLTREQRLSSIQFCDRQYLSKGVTTTVIAGGAGLSLPDLIEANRQKKVHLRAIAMYTGGVGSPEAMSKLAKSSSIPDRVRVGAVKLLQDGSLQGYTGFLSTPYYQQPDGKQDYSGYPARPRGKLVEMVRKYHRAGFQIAIHGNGDAAIDDILFAFREAQQQHPRSDARHRIEHCQTPRDDQLDEMQSLGITPSFFVAHVYYWGDRHRDLFLGPQRAERISPLAAAQQRGLRFTIHNDTPVTPVDPLLLVWCAVNRETRDGKILGFDQRIDTYSALRAVTIDAAWQNFEENTKGTIEPGKLADFVVLADNPLAVPIQRLKDIRVLETIVGGESVYQRKP